ncbi:MAG: HNH endonuclease [Actinomycetota bacterium]|nr:HNH endonuclease [Actinomycetota bacterium]
MSVADVLNDLVSAVDAASDVDPAFLGDGETLVALHLQLARLEAVVTRATAAFDAAGPWEADGARSAASWVAVRCGLPVSTARRRVKVGRALRHMPETETAWLAGEINDAHAAPLAAARTPATADAFERDEAMLVGEAKRLTHQQFMRALGYWLQLADPGGVETDAAGEHEARRVHMSRGFGGMWFLDGLLDPVGGTAVAEALRRIEDQLFEADWADARARVGEVVTVSDLARTPAQRRADALVEMARRAGAVPPGARLPEPLFSVLVGYETFAGRICELADGTVVTPGTLVRWLDEAWVERIVFDGPDRIKNVGVRRRIFSGATRRSVEVRDRECFEEFCDVPAERCEIDHILPWAEGGLTVDENGRPACSYHNRRRHRRP